MSLNMYLGEVQAQTESMNAFCNATIQGMEQIIHSIDTFALDTVLQGQTYSSAKAYFLQTFRPLAQGIIYLCEKLIRQNDAFPRDFQSQVASTDVIEQEILEQIREIDGQLLEGKHILEIPVSNKNIRKIDKYIKRAKDKYDIEIRFREE